MPREIHHNKVTLHIYVARHAAFYSPLIATLSAGFLEQEGLHATYAVLPPGGGARELIRQGEAHIVQSAVSSSWVYLEKGERDLPVHFAQINCRDGFFLVSRRPEPGFDFQRLEGSRLLADHAFQPMTMLSYCLRFNGCDWSRIQIVDRGTPDQMEAAFRAGEGDYVHLQGPAPQQLALEGAGHIAVSIGESMPEVAFSSLLASRAFLETDAAMRFTAAYGRARAWVTSAAPSEIARSEASYFPGVSVESLTAAIADYQRIGCWRGGIAIPEDLYEQAVKVFHDGNAISQSYAYRDVVVPPPGVLA
jgi:NitT/TauT family transport system substrate-binding protein